ncbi:MAG: lycopene cyclase domain-containing protein [Leptolyngbya sp. SIO3F4]|nr:lycopene cyclase domain-containing protein [Leptolyngbya sp. SIO3F4]
METPWLYLILNAGTLSIPLIRSFESRVAFSSRWKALFAAMLIVAAFFLVWDVIFTMQGVWGFNPKYLSGIYLFELPLGEWLFFFTIPYACVFIYDVLNHFWPENGFFNRYARLITAFLIGFLLGLAIVYNDRAYTFWNFSFTALFLGYLYYYLKPRWLGNFYRAYAVGLIGFFGVNGILTGTGLEEQVVWYNSEEFMGIRLVTIPLEDVFYGLLLIAMNVWLYEYFQQRFGLKSK